MARRKSDNDVNPEEFLESRDEPEDRENLQEIIRGVKGSQGDESLADAPAIATASPTCSSTATWSSISTISSFISNGIGSVCSEDIDGTINFHWSIDK